MNTPEFNRFQFRNKLHKLVDILSKTSCYEMQSNMEKT